MVTLPLTRRLALAGALLCLPSLASGQAEPAPGYAPPRRGPPQPRVRVAADLRLSGPLGDAREVVAPLGWGFGLHLSASLLPLGPLRLGFGLDFAQDRFSRELPGYPERPQRLIHNTFAFLGLLDLPTRWVRPYLGLGPGLSSASHTSPLADFMNQSLETRTAEILPLLRLSGGIGVSPLRWLEIGVSAEMSFTFSDTEGGVQFKEDGTAEAAAGRIFAPGWWSAALWAGYRFL